MLGFDATAIGDPAVLEMVEAALFRIGRSRSSFRWNDLRVTRGEHVRLPQDAARLPGGLAEIVTGDAAAPFRAQAIVASRVVLERDAELHITGIPTVMIVEELVFNGGRLFVSPASHFTIGIVVGRPAGL